MFTIAEKQCGLTWRDPTIGQTSGGSPHRKGGEWGEWLSVFPVPHACVAHAGLVKTLTHSPHSPLGGRGQ